jgi:peptide/nickel transport system substrate-binding protein
LSGHGQPANTLPPPGMWAGLLSPAGTAKFYAGLPSYTFSMAKAKAELAQSTHPKGFNTSVVYPDRSPELGKVALSLADNLKPLGINVTVTQIPYASWVAHVFSHQNLGMEFVAALHSSPSPSVLTNLIANTANTKAGGFNFPGYSNATVDANLAKFGSLTNTAARATAFESVLTQLGNDVEFTPVFWLQDGIAVKSGITFNSFNTQSYYTPWANAITKK